MAEKRDHALRRQDDRRAAVLMDEMSEQEATEYEGRRQAEYERRDGRRAPSGVSGPAYCPPCGLCQNCRYVPA